MKEQKKNQATGKITISKAALALNSAEMGIEGKQEDQQAIVAISSDELYTNFGDTDKKTLKNISQ